MTSSAFTALRDSFDGLSRTEQAWLDAVPLARMVAALDESPRYRLLGPGVTEVAAAVGAQGGSEWMERYLRLVTLTLIVRERARPPRLALPSAVADRRSAEFDAIVAQAPDAGPWPQDLAQDRFLKDVGIARGQLIPAGVFVCELLPSLPAPLVEGWTAHLAEHGAGLDPTGPWLELHVLQRRSTTFTADGWRHAYGLLAGILEANPECAGHFGSSWLLDPALGQVSPHLAWYGEMIEALGAVVFPLGTDADSINDATSTSRTRKRLYDEGRWVPVRHGAVARTERFISWIRSTQ